MDFARKDRLTVYIVTTILAVEVMLSFSSFGYVSIGALTLSFVPIGVYAMAFFRDLRLSLLASLVFGVSSMLAAGVGSGSDVDYLYSPHLSGDPVASIILAVGTRLFLGFISFCTIARALQYQEKRHLCLLVATFLSQTLYTIVTFIVGALLFPHVSGENISVWNVVVNLFLEALMFSLVVVYMYQITQRKFVIEIAEMCRQGVNKTSQKVNTLYVTFSSVAFMLFNVAIGSRYLQMQEKVLQDAGVQLDGLSQHLLMHLEIQQLLSLFALSVIIVMLGMLIYFYVLERQERLTYRADRDMMTGLYNRVTAKQKIKDLRKHHSGNPYTFIMVDVDGLKGINDNLGHAAGDEAIKGVANALKTIFWEKGIVARMGGDEFMVFLDGVASEQAVTPSLQELQKLVAGVSVAKGMHELHVSIGVKLDPEGQIDIDTVYHYADEALYQAKKSGKNTFTYHK